MPDDVIGEFATESSGGSASPTLETEPLLEASIVSVLPTGVTVMFAPAAIVTAPVRLFRLETPPLPVPHAVALGVVNSPPVPACTQPPGVNPLSVSVLVVIPFVNVSMPLCVPLPFVMKSTPDASVNGWLIIVCGPVGLLMMAFG